MTQLIRAFQSTIIWNNIQYLKTIMIFNLFLYSVLILLSIRYLQRYLKHFRFVTSFPNPGIFFPFLGHAYMVLGTSPEDILQVAMNLKFVDEEQRKVAGILGQFRKLKCISSCLNNLYSCSIYSTVHKILKIKYIYCTPWNNIAM